MHPMCSGTVPRPGSNRSEHLFFFWTGRVWSCGCAACSPAASWRPRPPPPVESCAASGTAGRTLPVHGAPGVTCTNGERPGRADRIGRRRLWKGHPSWPDRQTNLPTKTHESFVISGMHVSRPTRGPMCRAKISDGRKQGIINGLTNSGRGTTQIQSRKRPLASFTAIDPTACTWPSTAFPFVFFHTKHLFPQIQLQ